MTEEMKVMEEAMTTNIAERVARLLVGAQVPDFGKGSPTVKEVSKILGKDITFVREGIEKGWLPIGICKVSENGRREFYVSPKKLWEVTGYVWREQ